MDSEFATDVPKDQHGFVLSGTGTVYGSHLAMFNMAQHRWHTVIEATLPDAVKKAYLAARKADPKVPIIVVNPENAKTTLPEMLEARGFPSELWTVPENNFKKAVVLAKDFTVKAARIVRNRPFNDADSYPAKPRYVLFGSAGEAHISHYMTKQYDYQLLAQLAAVPTGLTAQQLADGVLVDLTKVAENHKPSSDPLEPYRDKQLDAVVVDTGAAIKLAIGPTRWFDTKELNHQPHSMSATLSEYLALASV